ncbi:MULTISPECIES: DUF3618 domain-containing protein [Rhodococcus]|uniref:Cell division protein FtsB n=1 Tax=Rhodococcus oxybenzonivorans TaxID=1990687 RepID=A0A2S2C3N2_9NOCA|nr:MULTISPECIES: DUF3618 domain-containing protein [Rhodococcus]AWK75469.1 cell division protein FtsB [Rhodococcus oxybenzonivorans]MDV7244538.1 DUF3618 domain-containing protein [Rhodococcus oxybenzonivorans]MDV7264765.1 DUF3618 domain-containing protein [Rhodococcus oxybenzonivorans]MDV7274219.1 DUF3618 domain-containing protein [Rhodococcus oxybenzonivorans]MDV7335601.1 DUF3618 domain-containing protein [Rhodococcus oxybenzonivorans]
MPRDTDSIEREIENARNQLASTLDELTVRTNPKRLVENTKQTLIAKFNEPAVKYGLIAVGAVVGLLVLRKALR